MPPDTPVTTPLDDPMVATLVEVLVQIPLDVASANVVVALTHTVRVPVIPAGVEHGFKTCAHQVSQ